MKLTILRQTFNGGYVEAVGLHRKQRARLRAAAVDEDGTCAALARVTANVSAGEDEMFPEKVNEEHARLHVRFPNPAVDGDGNLRHLPAFDKRSP
jgi:hypothetical protein